MFHTKDLGKFKTHILCSSTFFQKLCHLRNNEEKYGRAGQAPDDNTIWGVCLPCWITKATDTHSEHVILIAFPQPQWLHELAAMLCYTYIAYLVLIYS
jgi:hypothetical protein